jgi:hypothetical protein
VIAFSARFRDHQGNFRFVRIVGASALASWFETREDAPLTMRA